MTYWNISLIIATVVWMLFAWGAILPIFSMPVARIKREMAQMLLILGSVSILIEWLTQRDMHVVSILSLCGFVLISGVILYLLRRLDYYVEEILQELFILAISSAGIGVVTSIWYWGIDVGVNLFFLRMLVAFLPVVFFAVSWQVARQKYSLWAGGIFILLLAVKWVTLAAWGIWTIILLLLYSTLVGYVAHWMVTTTYAEKVFSWNVAPAKVWSILVLSAGILVIFF